jgi:hypothetical protein
MVRPATSEASALRSRSAASWQDLYFFPDPHQQASLRPTLAVARRTEPLARACRGARSGRCLPGGSTSRSTSRDTKARAASLTSGTSRPSSSVARSGSSSRPCRPTIASSPSCVSWRRARMRASARSRGGRGTCLRRHHSSASSSAVGSRSYPRPWSSTAASRALATSPPRWPTATARWSASARSAAPRARGRRRPRRRRGGGRPAAARGRRGRRGPPPRGAASRRARRGAAARPGSRASDGPRWPPRSTPAPRAPPRPGGGIRAAPPRRKGGPFWSGGPFWGRAPAPGRSASPPIDERTPLPGVARALKWGVQEVRCASGSGVSAAAWR